MAENILDTPCKMSILCIAKGRWWAEDHNGGLTVIKKLRNLQPNKHQNHPGPHISTTKRIYKNEAHGTCLQRNFKEQSM